MGLSEGMTAPRGAKADDDLLWIVGKFDKAPPKPTTFTIVGFVLVGGIVASTLQLLSPIGSIATDSIEGVVIAASMAGLILLLRAYEERRGYVYRLVSGALELAHRWRLVRTEPHQGLDAKHPTDFLRALFRATSSEPLDGDRRVAEILRKVESQLVATAAYDEARLVASARHSLGSAGV